MPCLRDSLYTLTYVDDYWRMALGILLYLLPSKLAEQVLLYGSIFYILLLRTQNST